MFAVVEMKGHQYIVQEGDELVIDKVGAENGADYTVDRVLAARDADQSNIKLGQPTLDGASVTFEVKDTRRGDKIKVVKFQRKTRYHRNFGFRPLQSHLVVKKIKL